MEEDTTTLTTTTEARDTTMTKEVPATERLPDAIRPATGRTEARLWGEAPLGLTAETSFMTEDHLYRNIPNVT